MGKKSQDFCTEDFVKFSKRGKKQNRSASKKI